jgi:hypothetical protein
MPILSARYRLAGTEVVSESVDGELLIINLADGTYYSSDGAGDQIWALLVKHATLVDIAAWLGARYGADSAEMQRTVLDFVEELEREQLVVPYVGDAPPAPGLPSGSGQAFRPPVLHKFTDFQDLLRLDPVHEVDRSAGWPHAKPSGDPSV